MSTSNTESSPDMESLTLPKHTEQVEQMEEATSNAQLQIIHYPETYGYKPAMFEHEDLDKYRPGGLHPIIIGDTLGEGRYVVCRKLGAGGFATVWLCRDQEEHRWVAVKVLGAEASLAVAKCQTGELAMLKHFRNLKVPDEELAANHVCLIDDFFIERGPNGKHFCFILPVFGGDIRRAWADYSYKPEILRDICAQMLTAMRYLHDKGICHGDFRPANILYTVDGVQNATEEEIDEMFPMCEEEELGRPIPKTGEEGGPHLPRFVTSSTSFRRSPQEEEKINVVLCDFGEAYFINSPPRYLGIPLEHAPPEVFLNSGLQFSCPTDIWSLGVSILQVRHHQQLVVDISIPEAVECLEADLGPLPEPYRSVWVKNEFRGRGYQTDASTIPSAEPVSWPSDKMNDRQARFVGPAYTNSLEMKLRQPSELGVLLEEDEEWAPKPGQTLAPNGVMKWLKYKLPTEEADQLFDLLSNIFKYRTDERLTTSEIVAHPWFSGASSNEGAGGIDTDADMEAILGENQTVAQPN